MNNINMNNNMSVIIYAKAECHVYISASYPLGSVESLG